MTTDNLKRYGVFDVGSNSVRALVYENGKTLFKGLITTRLGEGLTASGKLSDEAVKRTLNGIGTLYVEVLKLNPNNVYVFATEAVRSAENGNVFVTAVKDTYGLDVDVLSGDEEGEIGLAGALAGNDGGIIDIGGASAEIAVSEGGKTVYSHSLPLGAVRIKEICGENEEKLRELVDKRIKEYGAVPERIKFYAVGGTATSLCACFLGLEKYNGDKVNGTAMTVGQVYETYEKIRKASMSERTEKLHIGEKRAEIIVGGAYLLWRIMREFSMSEIIASENDNMLGYLKKKVFRDNYGAD